MQNEEILESTVFELQRLQRVADGALAQVSSDDLFRKLDAESNSLAELMKHVSGTLRSRWTDFLTTDGEKPDRNRDSEFVTQATDTPENLTQRWEAGWGCLFDALRNLRPEDLDRTVQIRNEAHSVIEAVHRTMVHCANHVGQIVFLAKHLAGSRWQSLSIPRGMSEQFHAALRQKKVAGYLGTKP